MRENDEYRIYNCGNRSDGVSYLSRASAPDGNFQKKDHECESQIIFILCAIRSFICDDFPGNLFKHRHFAEFGCRVYHSGRSGIFQKRIINSGSGSCGSSFSCADVRILKIKNIEGRERR